MENIILINNPPFKWQTKIYRKYANRFKEDIWILHKANTLKEGLYTDSLYDFVFNKGAGIMQIAHNFGGNNKVLFNKCPIEYIELYDFIMGNKREIDIDNDNLNYLLAVTIKFTEHTIGHVEHLPANKNELKKIIKKRNASCVGLSKNKSFKCLIFDNEKELNYWKLKAENYRDKYKYLHKKFAKTEKNGGSGKNGQYFTPDNKADELYNYLKTVNKNDFIIDICCGNGSLLKAAERAGHPKDKLIGYDIDNDCITKLQNEGYNVKCMDILKNDPFNSPLIFFN